MSRKQGSDEKKKLNSDKKLNNSEFEDQRGDDRSKGIDTQQLNVYVSDSLTSKLFKESYSMLK